MIAGLRDHPKPTDCRTPRSQAQPVGGSTLVRWGKFNLVGVIGIVVQFAALFFLKSVLHLQYLVSTAIAVEVAVLHNFVWHERFTWVDRIWVDRIWADRVWADRIWVDRIAVGMTKQKPGSIRTQHRLNPIKLSPGVFRRFWRFHLANGLVSILGNLAMMKALAGAEHMNYLIANIVAITACSLVNFLFSDQWVFEN